MDADISPSIPNAFKWRRLHSLMGIWLSIYLVFHLLTNSQAALLIGNNGQGFIEGVNSIHDLPFLPVIEIVFLAIPIFLHAIWGIYYMWGVRYNSSRFETNGKETYLPEYGRNHAYTWQRLTAWFLVFAIAAHVIHMRFIEKPLWAPKDNQSYYMVKVDLDKGLYTLAPRLQVKLYDESQIQSIKKETPPLPGNILSTNAWTRLTHFFQKAIKKKEISSTAPTPDELIHNQQLFENHEWMKALTEKPLKKGEAIAVSPSYGTAELLMLRETFKMPLMIVLYTIFVLTACFHAYNGLWTFLIKWGVTLTERSQRVMLKISTAVMIVVAFLGLSTIWMTYWINLKQ